MDIDFHYLHSIFILRILGLWKLKIFIFITKFTKALDFLAIQNTAMTYFYIGLKVLL